MPSKVQEVLYVLPCTLKHLRSDSHYICVKDLRQGMKILGFISVNVISIDPWKMSIGEGSELRGVKTFVHILQFTD